MRPAPGSVAVRRLYALAIVVPCALAAPGCSSGGDAPPGGDASGADALPPGPDAPGAIRLATGVALEGLAIFQGVRVGLFEAGAPLPRNAPIVAGRRAVVRAYIRPGTRAGDTFAGELELREGDRVVTVLRDERAIPFLSDDAAPETVLAFELPGELVTPTVSISVRLVEPAGDVPAAGAPHAARLPRDGSAHALDAEDDAAGLHLVLVPLRWDADGSGRLPDTSAAQLERFRALLTAVFPIVDLTIEVHAPVPWSDGYTFGGNVDFGDVNTMLLDLRADDGAPSEAYYYALVQPEASFDAYCGSSCVTGQSFVVDSPADGDYRVGSGVGFPGEDTAWTMLHELGHEHGREHAPCDAGGADPAYPYAGGALGVWGFDPRRGAFIDPSTATDFMGYCEPVWTSDYTWGAIFDRTVAVSALAAHTREDVILVRLGAGVAEAAGRTRLPPPRSGRTLAAAWLDAAGRAIAPAAARAMAQSHTEERVVVLSAPPPAATAVQIEGVIVALGR